MIIKDDRGSFTIQGTALCLIHSGWGTSVQLEGWKPAYIQIVGPRYGLVLLGKCNK